MPDLRTPTDMRTAFAAEAQISGNRSAVSLWRAVLPGVSCASLLKLW